MNRYLLLASFVAWSVLTLCGAANARGGATTLPSADGACQISVPDGWAAMDFHLDTVAIGAANQHRGEYVEVIVELPSKYNGSFQEFAAAKCDAMASSMNDPLVVQGQNLQVNGQAAIRFEIHGKLPGANVKIGYLLTVMKTETHYVQIVAWTVDKHFDDCRAELAGLAQGFSQNKSEQ